MKKIIFSFVLLFFIISNYNLFSCGGSCLKCHMNLNLKKPKAHQYITSCIECHQKGCGEEKEDAIIDGNVDSCGQDCFECHTTLPKDSNHKVISECIQCHKNLTLIHE